MTYTSFAAARSRSTNRSGGSFDPAVVEAVWRKGQVSVNNDSAIFRKDACGAWMKRSDYGSITSKYGWEVDHIIPVAKGGGDELSNLQPLQWENNRHKSDNFPQYTCAITAA